MEQQSRVKKYAQLREMIAQDHEETNFHDALAPFARRLSAVDERFNVDPQRAAYKDYVPEHAKTKAYQELFAQDSEDLITNDFLEQFIEEVKNYNVQEGTRVTQETTENVLHSYMRQQQNEIKHEPENNETSKSRNLEQAPEVSEAFDTYEQEFELEEDPLINDVLERIEKDVQLASSTSGTTMNNHEDWFSQTQQLSKAVETMGSSITSVNEKILATNRLVNFLLAIFILGLIIVCAYLVYMILGIQGLL